MAKRQWNCDKMWNTTKQRLIFLFIFKETVKQYKTHKNWDTIQTTKNTQAKRQWNCDTISQPYLQRRISRDGRCHTSSTLAWWWGPTQWDRSGGASSSGTVHAPPTPWACSNESGGQQRKQKTCILNSHHSTSKTECLKDTEGPNLRLLSYSRHSPAMHLHTCLHQLCTCVHTCINCAPAHICALAHMHAFVHERRGCFSKDISFPFLKQQIIHQTKRNDPK